MAKRKTKMTDQDALKHYTPGEGLPSASRPGADEGLPVLARKLLDKSLASKPEFKKAVLAVDRVMSNRKSAVMKTDKAGRKKWRKSPTKKR
jgi:hypothetical protein